MCDYRGILRLSAGYTLGLFQKFHRQLCLLLLVLFGLACGQLAATLAGTLLRPEIIQVPPSKATPQSTSDRLSRHDLNLILQNNPFDPDARGARKTLAKAPGPDKTRKRSPRTDLTLIGTTVADSRSSALIGAGREIKLFHREETLPGGGRVESISRNRVTIRNADGSSTELTLREDAPRSRPSKTGKSSGAGIREAGDNRWTVSRATAEAARTNIASELRLAQMEPRIIDGRTDGFLVRKLMPKSLLTKMGIKRGDVILRVNNMTLDSPEKALQILQQLREARHLTVDLERRDKPMTFAYEID